MKLDGSDLHTYAYGKPCSVHRQARVRVLSAAELAHACCLRRRQKRCGCASLLPAAAQDAASSLLNSHGRTLPSERIFACGPYSMLTSFQQASRTGCCLCAGFDWHPDTGALWATNNARQELFPDRDVRCAALAS